MIETAQAFGVDIGGSGIKAAPVDLTKGDFAEPRLKILTPEVSTPQAVAKIVKQQLDHFEVPESAPVGIAFPAPIKPGQHAANKFNCNSGLTWVFGRWNAALHQIRPGVRKLNNACDYGRICMIVVKVGNGIVAKAT